jgi:2'-5' RNA ligase
MVPGKHVVYFALQPPPEAQAQALALAHAARGKHRLSGKPSLPERLHVSLNNLGAFKRPPGPVVAKALEAVEAVVARPFVIQFNRMGSWGVGDGDRPIVLWGDEGVIGAGALYSTIHQAMRRLDMAPRREIEIVPHMTLLRDKAAMPETFIEPVSWRVEAFVLIHAVHGEGRFDVVGRVPLSG